jgi:hypothetical protein
MSFDLEMVFTTDTNREYTHSVDNVRDDVESVVSAVMDEIITSGAVITEYGSLIGKMGAILHETTSTPYNVS